VREYVALCTFSFGDEFGIGQRFSHKKGQIPVSENEIFFQGLPMLGKEGIILRRSGDQNEQLVGMILGQADQIVQHKFRMTATAIELSVT
jgi:hypothetical protein